MGQCTAGQARILEKYNYNSNVDFETASRLIDGLKNNGWKRPNGGGNQQQRSNYPPQGYQNQGGRPQTQHRPQQRQYQAPPTQRQQPPQYAAPPTQRYGNPPQNGGGQGGGGGYDPDTCSPKQAALLNKFGYDTNVSFAEASAIIDELKANNWQRQDQVGGPQFGGYDQAPGYDQGGYGDAQVDNGSEPPWGSDVPQFG